MEFEAVIGLEIHVQLKTKSKMFSSAPVTYGEEANSQTALLDFAFPGAMPTVNKQAVIFAIQMCHALHMEIDHELWFDRKNYFYSDLPKGFQITQYKRPLGKCGYLDIEDRKINIERLHIEEDTCKQLHFKDHTLLDFNRAGIPLLEIVSLPELHNGEEAALFVEKMRSIVTFLGISDGRMEEGSLRCDVNVSIKPVGKKEFGDKVEIKNLNSIANIQKAIDYEISRQAKVLESGKTVTQETMRFDENKKQTVPMRLKTESVDYKYFTEPNIVPIRLSDEFIKDAIESSPELAESKYQRYLKLGLNEYDASQLISSKEASDYFDEVVKDGVSIKLAANWILVDVQSVLNKRNITIKDFPIKGSELASLIKLVQEGRINNKQAREIFAKMINGGVDVKSIVTDANINEPQEIKRIVNEVLDANEQAIQDYKSGKTRIIGYIVGQVIKATEGKVDIELTKKIVIEELNNR